MNIFLRLAFLLLTFSSILHAQEKRFTILHTSDEHSTLLPLPLTDYKKDTANPTLGGFARLATKVKQIKSEKGEEPVILLSSGDIMGGSPFAWLILQQQSHEAAIMQKIGYSAMTIGNHEFDYGPDVLAEYLLRSGYQQQAPGGMSLIASNLDIPANHSLAKAAIETNKIITLPNGIKLGIFGILGAGAYSLAPYAPPVKISNQFDACEKQVKVLKDKGADVIVLLSHSGIAEDREMAKKIKGIDIILGGHDHINTPEPEIVNGTILVHPDYYLRHVGKLELSYNTSKKELSLVNKQYLLPLDHTVPEDSLIAAYISECQDSLNAFLKNYSGEMFTDIRQNIIQSAFPVVKDKELVETNIGNYIADAMRLAGGEVIGEKVDFAFQGNGVIRADIIPGSMSWSKEQFSLFDLLTIVGLGSGPDKSAGYPMISVYLTEKEIYNVLEVTAMLSQVYGDNFFLQVSGIQYDLDPGKSMWMKIPYLNLPIPANFAVNNVRLYQGEGIQPAESQYTTLDRNGDRLFHVVTDYYLAAFLPMVGELLPKLSITFKNKEGKEVSLDDCIVRHDGREFKVWEAVARYSATLKEMPEVYKVKQGRIHEQRGVPLVVWTITALVLLFTGIILLIRKLLKKRRVKAVAA